ncbi:MAG: bifunctional oligoribonuclease/PAP phosphatase NrnA [Clostridia bacterium]|nr:bifunctional oligoribonuclease/PAP phosphatase NrnA [Clostridia bacterium]
MNNCKDVSIKQACRFLKKHDNYVIITHAQPDGDTLGSASALCLGLRQLGKKVTIICPDEIPEKYGFFTLGCVDSSFEEQTVIACDVADLVLIGKLRERYEGKIDLCIDHHVSNKRFSDKLLLDAKASACGEIIYAVLKRLKVNVNRIIAAALYCAISTDTGCFKYSNTTAKSHRIVADLFDMGVDYENINRLMFETKSRGRVEMERRALDGMTFHFDDKCAVMVVTAEMRKETGCGDDELEGVTAIPRTIEGVLAGVTIKEKDNGAYKISLRTYPPLNASVICQKLGGGGHRNAAGCELEGSLDSVIQKVLEQVKIALEEFGAGDYSC